MLLIKTCTSVVLFNYRQRIFLLQYFSGIKRIVRDHQGPVVQKPVNVNPGLVEILWPKLQRCRQAYLKISVYISYKLQNVLLLKVLTQVVK